MTCAIYPIYSLCGKEVCTIHCYLACFIGLHHQGVFRVSGAQVEINQFKNVFESGEFACFCECLLSVIISRKSLLVTLDVRIYTSFNS